MRSLGMAWYMYMSNMGMDRRYSKYFDKCNTKMCHFVGMLNACASRLFKVGIQMSLWRLAWYAKCGIIDDSQRVFNKMPSHNVVT